MRVLANENEILRRNMREESNWENGGDRGMEENMERDCEGLDGAFYRWEIEFLDVDFEAD